MYVIKLFKKRMHIGEVIMIQDISPKQLLNQYKNQKITDKDYVLFFNERQILLNTEDKLRYLTYEEVVEVYTALGLDVPECRFLFNVDEESYFLSETFKFNETLITEFASRGYEFHRMYDLRRRAPKEAVFAGVTAWHLFSWYRTNKFCGACGCKMIHDEKERMMRCEHCGNMVFPKIAPAVIVGLIDGDRMMMTKYADREYKRYALIAGFTEIGETMEDTVRREVFEEVGLRVKNVTYYKSQPWGFAGDMLLGFFCELDGSDEVKMDETELSVAEWVHYKDIPEYNEGLSLTEEMMNYFKRQRDTSCHD